MADDGVLNRSEVGWRIEAPLRIDFCGGYTDLAEISQVTGTAIANLAIDLYRDPARTEKIRFEVWVRPHNAPTAACEDDSSYSPSRDLLAYLKTFLGSDGDLVDRLELHIHTPVSTGLGASGALSAMLTAAGRFCQGWGWAKIRDQSFHDAQRFEKEVMQVKGGYQDFISAIYGGYSYIAANPEDEDLASLKGRDRFQLLNCPVQDSRITQYFNRHVFVVYSKRRSSSSDIIDDIVSRTVRGQEILDLSQQIFRHNAQFHTLVQAEKSMRGEAGLANSSEEGLAGPLQLPFSPAVFAQLTETIQAAWRLRQQISRLTENPVLAAVEQALVEDLYCTHGVGAGGSVLILYAKPDRTPAVMAKLADLQQVQPICVFYPKINPYGLSCTPL